MKESVEKAVNHLTINLLTAYQCSSYLQQCQDKIKDKIKTNKSLLLQLETDERIPPYKKGHK